MQQDASEGAADVPSQDTVLDEEEVDLNLPACSLFFCLASLELLPSYLRGAAAFFCSTLGPWGQKTTTTTPATASKQPKLTKRAVNKENNPLTFCGRVVPSPSVCPPWGAHPRPHWSRRPTAAVSVRGLGPGLPRGGPVFMGCCCRRATAPPRLHQEGGEEPGPSPARPVYNSNGDCLTPVAGRHLRPRTWDSAFSQHEE